MMAVLCKCGCGEQTRQGNVFVHGHNARFAHPMQGKRHSEASIRKMKDNHSPFQAGEGHPMFGRKQSDASRAKMSASHNGVPLSEKCRANIGISSKKTWAKKSEAEKQAVLNKRYAAWGGNKSPMKNKHHTEEAKRKNADACRRVWQDQAHARKCLVFNSPNKQETKLMGILDALYPDEWKFVGDGQVIIAGKCPDFINVNGQKKIIELYGERWHHGENPKDRADIFSPFGYETLVIWVKELQSMKKLKPVLDSFCGGV